MWEWIPWSVWAGPSQSADFEFHLSGWFGGEAEDALPILPEVKKIKAGELACIFGKDEGDCLCRSLDESTVKIMELPGGHHFDGDYPALADRILSLKGLDSSPQ